MREGALSVKLGTQSCAQPLGLVDLVEIVHGGTAFEHWWG